MKKRLEKFGLFSFLFLLGIVSIHAASKTIYSDSAYSINYGGVRAAVNISAPYPVAQYDISVSAINGLALYKTKFVAGKLENGEYSDKATRVINISLYTSYLGNIGTIGSGTWSIRNQAFENSSKYVGWSGKLKYNSIS